jgi:hypothetical protein
MRRRALGGGSAVFIADFLFLARTAPKDFALWILSL